MKIIFSKDCMKYEQPGHPESPERVRSTYEFLKDKFEFVKPRPAQEADILLAHTPVLLEKVKSGSFSDPDTPNLPGMYEHAKLAAGAAIQAAELESFSLMRPPGHHATREFLGGFCYFNNIAIAVSHMLKEVDKVAILDFDYHHGNGTQDIFMGNKKVLYISLHAMFSYPGTGLMSEKNCHNYLIPPGSGEQKYMQFFKKALEDIKQFNPNLLAVSAGFDTYKDDPLSSLKLEKETYEKIGKLIADMKKPTFSVLEGGYAKELPECIYNFLNGLL
ncbi:MAG: histone deacetylase [Candidatus Aenigmatarchaeota archaeon]|nr:histone deacetylase [Nanoarchaeota archaeon]